MKKLFVFLLCFTLMSFAFCAKEIFFALDGRELTYKEVLSAPKTILFLWTSRCPYCVDEFVRLNKNSLYPGIDFYFINLGEGKSTVEKFANSLKLKEEIKRKILLDPDAFSVERFSVIGVPTFIFLKNGEVISRSYYLDERISREIFKDE